MANLLISTYSTEIYLHIYSDHQMHTSHSCSLNIYIDGIRTKALSNQTTSKRLMVYDKYWMGEGLW